MKFERPVTEDRADRARGISELIEEDLAALTHMTAQELPTLDQAAQTLRERSLRDTKGGFVMKDIQSSRLRPWLATAGGVVLMALGLAFVPVSFDRTTGYEARLSLAGSAPAAQSAQMLGEEFMKALRASNVSCSEGTGSEQALAIVATVRHGSRADVSRAANAFARVLTQRGSPATIKVLPIVEHVLGSVYALAAERIAEIRIERDGKSPAQLEAEIQARLEASGLLNSSASVTQEGDQTTIKIRAQGSEAAPSGARVVVERK